ncbi:hypothetical protein WMY93_030269 [Mugilogobius chulae]|uniref:Protein kinase domain-containing protein n=1 Tax=Mugilogobius chulae TaxID=88201 RepID=A0AAW0MP60_9GOBI
MSSALRFNRVPHMNANNNTISKYKMVEMLGKGCFGKVAKCRNQATGEIVALKMIDRNWEIFQQELDMLEYLKELDPERYNLVKVLDVDLDFLGHQCLAFEMLDISVHDLQKKSSFSLSQIRPMAKQLLTALHGLKSVGVMHTDIKPDNIMLVNHLEQPFKVKLIDFGLAKLSSQVETGQDMQPICFCSPEVMLGLPLWEAVDMWSLACCFLIFYSGNLEFRAVSEFEYLRNVVRFFGKPADELLNTGIKTRKYFVSENSQWRLKSLQELIACSSEPIAMSGHKPSSANLKQHIRDCKILESDLERSDREAFLDLLEKMFEMDARKRITPSNALLHPFITMKHLPEGDEYTNQAHKLMQVVGKEGRPLPQQNEAVIDRALNKPAVYQSAHDNTYQLRLESKFTAGWNESDCWGNISQTKFEHKRPAGMFEIPCPPPVFEFAQENETFQPTGKPKLPPGLNESDCWGYICQTKFEQKLPADLFEVTCPPPVLESTNCSDTYKPKEPKLPPGLNESDRWGNICQTKFEQKRPAGMFEIPCPPPVFEFAQENETFQPTGKPKLPPGLNKSDCWGYICQTKFEQKLPADLFEVTCPPPVLESTNCSDTYKPNEPKLPPGLNESDRWGNICQTKFEQKRPAGLSEIPCPPPVFDFAHENATSQPTGKPKLHQALMSQTVGVTSAKRNLKPNTLEHGLK